MTEAVATNRVELGQGFSVSVEYTAAKEDGSTITSETGVATSGAPLDEICAPPTTSTSAPPSTAPTTPGLAAPPPPPPGSPAPARPLPGSANFTG